MLKGNVVAVTGVNSGIVKERKRGDSRVASVSAGQNLVGRLDGPSTTAIHPWKRTTYGIRELKEKRRRDA